MTKILLAALALTVLCDARSFAQFETATVLGTVRDTTNAVVPDAMVTLTHTATGVSLTRTTNAEGNYEFFTVSAGIYLVTVEKAGFAMAMIENVSVQVGSRLRVDTQMNVGQVSERIQVTGTAPLIETDTSARGQIITGDQTRALPLNGREYSSPCAVDHRCSPVRAEQQSGRHPTRRLFQCERPPQHVQQLSD